MHSSPDCPRCGMSLEPYHTKFHDPFDTYWRCPYCHYSCNADLSRTNWHNILDNEVGWYAKQGIVYKENLDRYIHIGMDEKAGMILILKFHSEFLDITKTLYDNLSTLLNRPTNQAFRVKLDTVYGMTAYNFAKACTLIKQYKPAAQYIEAAMRYVPSDNECFDMVVSLSEEIQQKNQEILAASPTDATPALPATPKPESPTPAPPPAATPEPPSKGKSSASGCLVWLTVMSLVVLFCIYQGISTIQSSHSAAPAVSASSAEQDEPYYVGNRKTKVFHVSTCSFVPRISENHVVEFDDRDKAINRGYRPCQKCLP